jgi:hypothetical protein
VEELRTTAALDDFRAEPEFTALLARLATDG